MTVPAPIPFIVGCGRSGTTLLRSIVDSHPEMAIPGENDFLHAQFKRRTPFSRGQPLTRELIDAALQAHPTTRASIGAHSAAAPAGPLTLPAWFRHCYGAYADSYGKERYGDKTPALVGHMDAISVLVPEAVFVHLIRDGRDVAQAYLAQEWGPATIAKAAEKWRSSVSAGRAAGLRMPRRRYFELRYEDLVADLEPSVRAVCEFVQLDYDPVMLDFRTSASRAKSYSRFPDAHASLDRAPTRGLRNWREEMSTLHRVQFELRAGPVLEICGYDPPLPQAIARRAAGHARRLGRLVRRPGRPARSRPG